MTKSTSASTLPLPINAQAAGHALSNTITTPTASSAKPAMAQGRAIRLLQRAVGQLAVPLEGHGHAVGIAADFDAGEFGGSRGLRGLDFAEREGSGRDAAQLQERREHECKERNHRSSPAHYFPSSTIRRGLRISR